MQIMTLTPGGGQPTTMTSREIAELTGKELSNVHRDIREMLDALKKDDSLLNHPQEDKDARGYTTCFYLNRELTDTLLTGYSVVARNRVIKRWHELETKPTVTALDLRDPKQLAAAALQLIEVNQELQATIDSQQQQIAQQAPKILALDRMARETDGAVCLRVAAKLVQVPEKQFINLLQGEHWIFRHHHSHTWQGYSDKEQAGLLELKRTTVTRDNGTEKTVEQVLVTPRGLAKVSELIERKVPWLRKTGTQNYPHKPDRPAAGVH